MKSEKFIRRNNLYEKILAFILSAGCIFMLIVDYGVNHDDWWTFLTFTFVSNCIAAVTYQLRAWNIVDKEKYFQKVWQHSVTTMLLVTFLVYWAVLSRDMDWSEKTSAFSSIWVHAFNPLIAVTLFVWQAFRLFGHNITFWHFTLSLVTPVIWVVIQQTMYYTSGITFYSIFDPNKHSMIVVYISLLGITALFVLIGMLLVVVNNYIRERRKS